MLRLESGLGKSEKENSMKYVVIVGDGMADQPVKELGGKTPLQKANTPNMDTLARKGLIGKVRTIPEGMHPGSDVANLSILGYDPADYYSGRAPLEAASMGIEISDNDVAYRCNLVTLKFDNERTRAVMEDYSSGHISTHEARDLIMEIGRKLGTEKIRFYPGVSYRHLMVWTGGSADMECTPPHDILGREINDYLPAGTNGQVIRDLMRDSVNLLERHPVNLNRMKEGKNPGNSVWFWGQGKRPKMPTFQDKYAKSGALVSAVDLTKGLGRYAGFEILQVPGITGWIDTNYEGKAAATLEALRRVDFVYLHVESPDEAGHSGNCEYKIRAIEDFDRLVVGKVLDGMEQFEEYRILLLPDHPTPLALRTHTADPVPFVIFDSRSVRDNENVAYDESITGMDDILVFEEGFKLMDYFIQDF
jgi:2,3-bisphosphoglycerate-independent phosphoglycerate mutase